MSARILAKALRAKGLIARTRGCTITVTAPDPVPVEHQAKRSGALGTPNRNHACDECGGAGGTLVWFGLTCSERRCLACGGSGEFTAAGKPAVPR